MLVQMAYDAGLTPHSLRTLACRVLRKAPDQGNWSAFPNVDAEVREKIDDAPWYRIYDIIEEIYVDLAGESDTRGIAAAEGFEDEINSYFREAGIGWQMVKGELQSRGADAFERTIRRAEANLARDGRTTAASELAEALRDLSRRPEADVTGAVQHALAAVECAARAFTGDRKSTLGKLIERHPDLFPPPLNGAVDKLWGYASNHARHLNEGGAPTFADAQLIVGFAATICNYLSARS